jgi:hypothetical protein
LKPGNLSHHWVSCANAGEASAASVNAVERQKARRDRSIKSGPPRLPLRLTPMPVFSFDHSRLWIAAWAQTGAHNVPRRFRLRRLYTYE